MRVKGVVVEIAARNAVVVMTSDGEFARIPFDKPVCVGQEIQFVKRPRRKLWKWSVAAVVMLALVGSAGIVNENLSIPGGNQAAYFVTLDINPSLEVAVNKEQRVVATRGLNEDGDQLLEKVKVTGRPFKQAVEIISQQAEQDGYLRSGENEIFITISSDGEEITTLKEITLDEDRIERQFSIQHEIENAIRDTLTTAYQAKVKVWQVPVEVRREARNSGVSPAQLVTIHIEQDESYAENEQANTNSTKVTTTLERKGEVKVFDFEIARPTLTPATWSRTDSSSSDNISLSTQRQLKGDLAHQE